MNPSDLEREPIEELAEDFVARHRRGERPSPAEYAAHHPEMAEEIHDLFPALLLLEEKRSDEGRPPLHRLGEYRIVREVGRGGMGVVYEAVQEPLGRRVALKVLPCHAPLEPVYLERFRREAQAAARLQHAHIVPVYGAGEHEGVPFYAMQFIQGRGLDALVREARRRREESIGPEANAADTPRSCPVGATPGGEGTVSPAAAPPAQQGDTAWPAWLAEPCAYFRQVAQIGLQAAEALAYAHQQGVLHRDVKPSNLLLDGQGGVWVTDFGLAKAEGQESVSNTGELVGTLRYLAPERFQGWADPRSDVYSLGLTLYELLTLRHAFDAADRAALIRQVTEQEPPAPRRVNPEIPRDLETIVLKTIAREPGQRYQSGTELADDLRRFLEDRPIQARRARKVEQAWRWCRRNPTVAGLTTAVVALILFGVALAAGGVGWVVRDRAGRQADMQRGVEDALAETDRLQRQGKWWEALAAVKRAQGLLDMAEAPQELHERIARRRAELEMVLRVEGIRERRCAAKGNSFDWEKAEEEYSRAFREFGIDVEVLTPEQAGSRIQGYSIAVELAAALDDWALVRRLKPARDDAGWQRLLATARAGDRDSRRTQFREAWERSEPQALTQMAASEQVTDLPAPTLHVLGHGLRAVGDFGLSADLLRRAQQQYPGDFWINFSLSDYHLRLQHPPRLDDAVRYATAAVAIRPESPAAQVHLGNALERKGDLDGALVAFRRAVRLDPDYPLAHGNLGAVLAQQGARQEALACFNEALRLGPRNAMAHVNLGVWQGEAGAVDEGILTLREAIRLQPDLAEAHYNLGVALRKKGLLDEAMASCREAIRLQPHYAEAHFILGLVHAAKGAPDEALAAYRRAIQLRLDFAPAHHQLGAALLEKGAVDEATSACREAVRLDPKLAEAHNNLGRALERKGVLDGAIAAYREYVRLRPHVSTGHYNLAHALATKGAVDEAIAAYREAIRLNPDTAKAYTNLGVLLVRKGAVDEGIAAYREAIRLDPNDAPAHCNLGNALTDKGALDEAIASYNRAIRLRPNEAVFHFNLGSALGKQRNREAAIVAYREALRHKPDYAPARQNLAQALAETAWFLANNPSLRPEDAKLAVERAREAVQLRPAVGQHWNILGAAHYRAGEWKPAVEALEKSMQLRNGGDSFAWFFLAMAHWRLGDKEQAHQFYDRAVRWTEKHAPQDKELRRFRAEAAELMGQNEAKRGDK